MAADVLGIHPDWLWYSRTIPKEILRPNALELLKRYFPPIP